MGWFNKKSESFTVDELLELPDKDIDKIIKKGGHIPVRSAKDLRKMKKDDRRRLEGEKSFGAVLAAGKEIAKKNRATNNGTRDMIERKAKADHGIKNPKLLPIKDTMHPAAYKQLLEREAKRQGLI